jgi:hypothetical protein
VLAAVAAGTLAVLGVGAVPAAADPGGNGKDPAGSPAGSKYQAPKGPSCTVRPSAGKSANDEWLSCVGVESHLDRVPSVGETATLRVTVRASDRIGPTDIRVELPPQLVWAEAPAGFSTRQMTTREPERAGQLATAQASRVLQPGQPATFTGVVRAVSAGAAQIQVRATATAGHEVYTGEDPVFLTVGEKGQAGRLGIAAKAGDGTVTTVPTGQRAARPAWLQPRSVGTEGLAKPSGQSGSIRIQAPCDTRVTGNWSYQDQAGVWRNSMNFQVQVWDQNSIFGDSLLAVGVTDGAGNYNLCFDANETGFFDSGTADIYVRFVSENSLWKVQRGGSPLAFRTGTTFDIVRGSTLNLGALTTGDPALHRGLHAFDEANDLWLFIPKPTNLCFDQNDSTCRQYVINWAPDSTDGTYYSTGSNDVHLAADDPNAAITVVHELSHSTMDDVYNDAFPPAPSCNPHSIQGTSSAGCAWTEGFAEWLPAMVYNDPFFRWPSGASLDLENASWGNGWGVGDTTEGRIAGSLIDISDFANEAYWDRYGEGFSGVWFTFTHHVSNTLAQFWAQRAGDGFNVADAGALACLYQNTVDYGFRDPLGNYAPLSRPVPTPHNFSYNTTTFYWSVVAVRPPTGADYDVYLYDDWSQTAFLGGSAFGGSTVDFVAVDSNRRAFGDYYPRVIDFAGTGTYQIELAQGTSILSPGSNTISMGWSNVVSVQDTFLTAGVPVTISVAPSNFGQDPELFLMGDDPANAATWVRGRPFALASSIAGGFGATETLTFTPTTSAWYGVVVVNKSGSGTYTLTRA